MFPKKLLKVKKKKKKSDYYREKMICDIQCINREANISGVTAWRICDLCKQFASFYIE